MRYLRALRSLLLIRREAYGQHTDRCPYRIRELIGNRISNVRLRHVLDRSIDQAALANQFCTGAWRNVGADCLVGGFERAWGPCFLFTFRNYKVFVERGHDTHAAAAKQLRYAAGENSVAFLRRTTAITARVSLASDQIKCMWIFLIDNYEI